MISWSLFWLSQGMWPKVDIFGKEWPDNSAAKAMAGKSIAGGFRAIIFQLKADLDHFAKDHRLRHYNSNLVCEFDGATRNPEDPTMLYNNVGSDARWQKNQYSCADWQAV